MNTPNYNMIGCPQCSVPLIDHLPQYESNQKIKTVKCTCCDYMGMREGFILLSSKEIEEYRNSLKLTNNVKQSNYSFAS
jgi:hypothetical protein